MNTAYVSFGVDQGEVFKLDLAPKEKKVILTNKTTECRELFGILALQDDEFVFTDIKDRTEYMANVHGIIRSKKTTKGPEGTVAHKTIQSVDVIKSELLNLTSVLKVIDMYTAEYPVDLLASLTVQSVPENEEDRQEIQMQERTEQVKIEQEDVNEEFEQLSEYDSESHDEELQIPHEIEPSISPTALDFMRPVTTRNGRSVKVSMKFRLKR
ncbi:unnamed protein product [Mytilus coruscus]|uniref:Uncharacterized protein n=1 Tax=Mytilus coruscus TaxID=42192 RepID=A0A6J8BTH2_MYTCO|nr:unnamed protein product [Mytilus coruscus]